MVPFQVAIELEEQPVSLLVEQLDQLADEEGFVRFDVRAAERRAVIFVNTEDNLKPPLTPQEAEVYFEAIHYPEQEAAFSFSGDFTPAEVRLIGQAIREHNSACGNCPPGPQHSLLW